MSQTKSSKAFVALQAMGLEAKTSKDGAITASAKEIKLSANDLVMLSHIAKTAGVVVRRVGGNVKLQITEQP